MAVYVDALMNHGWRLRCVDSCVDSCHLIADSIDELKDFAVNQLGMKLSWFQPKSSPHFDLVKSRRDLAVSLGAIELDRKAFVNKIRNLRGQLPL